MKKIRVANGITWVEIPEADLRLLCGCPADSVKHLIRHGLIAPVTKAGVTFETGPNAILLSDTPVQKGSLANLAEFPILQMLYRQGMIIPGHPNNTGRRPLVIGLGDQVRAQAAYFMLGNSGLSSAEEIQSFGVTEEDARELMRVKTWFSFGRIPRLEDLVDTRAVDADAIELAPGVIVHRQGFNRYQIICAGERLEVDLGMALGETYEPSYGLPAVPVQRQRFSVIHSGEGDGWDASRPCMASIVCHEGLLYLVDAGPYITQSLEALGIGLSEIEGVFHTHVHDDHFAGLTSLVRSERRMKYFAAPHVRATAQKKLAALMRIDESRFARFFEAHDLACGQWNDVGGMAVKPIFSPHPVETTALFFRVSEGTRECTYAHLADMPSFQVLEKLAAPGKPGAGGPALSAASRARFLEEVSAPVAVKKVDVGGGLIHGSAVDFSADRSERLILSHGIFEAPAAMLGVGTTVRFGDADVLLPGSVRPALQRVARASLGSWFPAAAAEDLNSLSSGPIAELQAGAPLFEPGAAEPGVRLVLSGFVELEESGGARRRLGAGALVGAEPGDPVGRGCRAASVVNSLAIPAPAWRSFISRAAPPDSMRRAIANRQVLARCALFANVRSEHILRGIASQMQRRAFPRGRVIEPALPGAAPSLLLLAEGLVDLSVGASHVETVEPGGFWGEERLVSDAPQLVEARAAAGCVCYAIPAGLLEDIPIVQWDLQETFERRLKSFRAGFRFEWSESFRVDVGELDDQHRKLFGLVNDLSERIGASGKIVGTTEQKRVVLEYTRFHFEREEALMERGGYPRLEQQKAEHAELLLRLERFVGSSERRARPRQEHGVEYLKDWLIRHTLLEDLKYREYFARAGIT